MAKATTASQVLQRSILVSSVICGAVLGVISFLGYLKSANLLPWLVPGLAAVLLAAFFFTYLSSGSIGGRGNDLSERLAKLEHLSYKRIANTLDIDPEGKRVLIAEAKAAILESAKEEALLEIKASIHRDEFEKQILGSLGNISRRLEQEIEALRRRSNVNLFIGISLGIAGLAILAFVAFRGTSPSADPKALLISSIPRLSLGVLVEFLAYFFLRLYKAAATEIRYFHNELTNQEARAVALAAARKDSAESLSQAITAFLQTERNFVLNKDQSTVSLEHRKLDISESQALVATLEGLLSKAIGASRQPPS